MIDDTVFRKGCDRRFSRHNVFFGTDKKPDDLITEKPAFLTLTTRHFFLGTENN